MRKMLSVSPLFMICALVVGADSSSDLSSTEKEVLKLINKERAQEELPPLKPSGALNKVARAHSANMAKQGKMEHELDGKTPFDRIKSSGYRYRFAGENIAFGDEDIPVKTIVAGWMDSKPHRENILHENFSETGIGAVRDGNGRTYYTQVFGKPR